MVDDAHHAATGTGYTVNAIACEFCGRLVPVDALDPFWLEQDISLCIDRETCSAIRHTRKKEWTNDEQE